MSFKWPLQCQWKTSHSLKLPQVPLPMSQHKPLLLLLPMALPLCLAALPERPIMACMGGRMLLLLPMELHIR